MLQPVKFSANRRSACQEVCHAVIPGSNMIKRVPLSVEQTRLELSAGGCQIRLFYIMCWSRPRATPLQSWAVHLANQVGKVVLHGNPSRLLHSSLRRLLSPVKRECTQLGGHQVTTGFPRNKVHSKYDSNLILTMIAAVSKPPTRARSCDGACSGHHPCGPLATG